MGKYTTGIHPVIYQEYKKRNGRVSPEGMADSPAVCRAS